VLPCHPTEAAVSFTEKFLRAPSYARGESWKRDEEVIGGDGGVRAAAKRDE
jgi:hypothetical protein